MQVHVVHETAAGSRRPGEDIAGRKPVTVPATNRSPSEPSRGWEDLPNLDSDRRDRNQSITEEDSYAATSGR
jgi:hypothetical protein